jgi:hypothetical protein
MRITVFAIVLFCCSCGNYVDEGMRELKQQCEKDSGRTIYKVVEADGYYDDRENCHHCWRDLILNNYRHIEFCVKKERPSITNVFSAPGCYRVEKIERSAESCDQRIDKKMGKYGLPSIVSYLKNSCFKSTKIIAPEAKYGLFSSYEEDIWISGKNRKATVSRTHSRIIDMSQGDKLAEGITYGLSTSSPITGNLISRGCSSVHRNYKNLVHSLPNSTLKGSKK